MFLENDRITRWAKITYNGLKHNIIKIQEDKKFTCFIIMMKRLMLTLLMQTCTYKLYLYIMSGHINNFNNLNIIKVFVFKVANFKQLGYLFNIDKLKQS